jgi:hypothetical protein
MTWPEMVPKGTLRPATLRGGLQAHPGRPIEKFWGTMMVEMANWRAGLPCTPQAQQGREAEPTRAGRRGTGINSQQRSRGGKS